MNQCYNLHKKAPKPTPQNLVWFRTPTPKTDAAAQLNGPRRINGEKQETGAGKYEKNVFEADAVTGLCSLAAVPLWCCAAFATKTLAEKANGKSHTITRASKRLQSRKHHLSPSELALLRDPRVIQPDPRVSTPGPCRAADPQPHRQRNSCQHTHWTVPRSSYAELCLWFRGSSLACAESPQASSVFVRNSGIQEGFLNHFF